MRNQVHHDMSYLGLLSRIAALRRSRANVIEAAGAQARMTFQSGWGMIDPSSRGWFPSENSNRVIDFGSNGESETDDFINSYAERGVPRFFVYLDPTPNVQQLRTKLDEGGFRKSNELSVLARDLSDTDSLLSPSPFVIKKAGLEDTEAILELLSDRHTRMPTGSDKVIGSLCEPNAEVFLAFYQERPAGLGVVHTLDGLAYLSNGTVLPDCRGHGGQKALIRARLLEAAKIGCDAAYVETYSFLHVSYRNLLACGFVPAYNREIYRYEFDPAIRSLLSHTSEGHLPPA